MSADTNRPTNRFLLLLRSWHGRIGVSAVALLTLLALTGIYLNHQDLFGLDPVPVEPDALLTTATPTGTGLVGLERVMEAARAEWGDVPLQWVQLRAEAGRLVYRVRRRGRSDEVTLDAHTGRLVAVRTQLHDTRYDEDGEPLGERLSWGRLFYELHTGRLLGMPGRLIADAAGVAVLLLASSGVYLFTVPRLRKWRTARRRAARHANRPNE
jgi:uncharacterized iron-regulated membrane protein